MKTVVFVISIVKLGVFVPKLRMMTEVLPLFPFHSSVHQNYIFFQKSFAKIFCYGSQNQYNTNFVEFLKIQDLLAVQVL